MAAAKRDYYEVLGIPRDAGADEIKRAFHARARDWHPDVAQFDEAEERFRELAEAYSVLSRHESRVLYDRYGYRGRGHRDFESPQDIAGGADARGENVELDIDLRKFEAERGTRRVVRYEVALRCETCNGNRMIGALDPDCEICGGTGRVQTMSDLEDLQLLHVAPCPVCLVEPCPNCEGTGLVSEEQRLRLRIPPGLEDGACLRVSGGGAEAAGDSIPGDLLVRVKVLPPPRDPQTVRLTAFALLLVAVATLVVYLLH